MRSKDRFHIILFTGVGITAICFLVAIVTAYFLAIYQPEEPDALADLFDTTLQLGGLGVAAVIGMLGSHLTPGDK